MNVTPKKRFMIPMQIFGGGFDYLEVNDMAEIEGKSVREKYAMLLDQNGFETTEENINEVMPHCWDINDGVGPPPLKLTKKVDHPVIVEAK